MELSSISNDIFNRPEGERVEVFRHIDIIKFTLSGCIKLANHSQNKVQRMQAGPAYVHLLREGLGPQASVHE